MEAQAHNKEGNYLWCEDWEIIEVLKFMFLGKTSYMNDTPPRRLKNNPLWSKSDIEKKAEYYMEVYRNADLIIEALRNQRLDSASRIS